MARELMPKSGIMMPHVVINRDAAVVGVSTVDGVAGAVDLTGKYLQKTDAADIYQTKTEGASKDYVLDSIQPIMEGALFKADPFVDNNTPFRSAGANGVESVDMMKVTTDNSIKIGSYASSVQGVEIHSAGRLQVVDQNDSGVETKYPVYSKRYRPEIEDLPFAAIGTYVKDSKGRTVGVTRTGINSDIKQLTQKVTFTQPVTIPDAVSDSDAVALKQMKSYVSGINSVNTSWSVIDNDTTTSPPGVNIRGGRINSVYQVGGAEQASAYFYSQKGVGDDKAKAILQANNSTLGVSKLLVFDTAGDLYTEGTVNSKRHFVSNPSPISFDGYWGSTSIPFHVDVPAVAGEGYLYPLISQKVYWASHYAAAWSLGTWCQASDPHFSLTWNAEAGQNKSWFFIPTSGNAAAPGSWVNGSDERHKSNISVVKNALEAVCSWRGAIYDKKDGGREVGLIAQDVEKDCPEAISEQERTFQDGEVIKDFKYLNTAGVSAAYHTEAIKDLAKLVESLSARVAELEKGLS